MVLVMITNDVVGFGAQDVTRLRPLLIAEYRYLELLIGEALSSADCIVILPPDSALLGLLLDVLQRV